MVKRTAYIGLLASCAVLCFSVGAVQGGEPLFLTLAQAVEEALVHNVDLKLASLALEQAELGMQRAEIVGDAEMLAYAREKLAEAQETHASLKRELITKVQNAYQEILYNTLSLERQAAAKARAEDQLRTDQNKFAVGLLSSLDIMRAEISLANAESNYLAARESLLTAKLRFNELLGLALDTEVILTEKPELEFMPFEFTFEECYAKALQVDPGVRNAAKELEKAKDAVAAAQSPFVPQVQLDNALADLARAEINLQKAETALYFQVRTAYAHLMGAAQTVEIKAREVELQQRILEAEEIKYGAGVVSNAQIVAQQEKLAAVEQEYSKALLDYSLGRSNLLQLMGLTVWGEEDAP